MANTWFCPSEVFIQKPTYRHRRSPREDQGHPGTSLRLVSYFCSSEEKKLALKIHLAGAGRAGKRRKAGRAGAGQWSGGRVERLEDPGQEYCNKEHHLVAEQRQRAGWLAVRRVREAWESEGSEMQNDSKMSVMEGLTFA